MAIEHIKEFNVAIHEAVHRVGKSAPKIADDILESAFPETCAAAHDEGAFGLLRDGATAHIRDVLKSMANGEPASVPMDDYSPGLMPYIEPLKNGSYYVPGLNAHVSVKRLTKQPELLDLARKYMRAKGEECIAEADQLDRLYEAVMAAAAVSV